MSQGWVCTLNSAVIGTQGSVLIGEFSIRSGF